MNVIEIPEDAPMWGVHANPDDIVVFRGVGYRVIAAQRRDWCNKCDCYSGDGCQCLPFDCYFSTKAYPHGTHLVRVCPEEGGEK